MEIQIHFKNTFFLIQVLQLSLSEKKLETKSKYNLLFSRTINSEM